MTTYSDLRELLLTAKRLRQVKASRAERERILHAALRGYLLGNDDLSNSEDCLISAALKYERYCLTHARPRLPIFKVAS